MEVENCMPARRGKGGAGVILLLLSLFCCLLLLAGCGGKSAPAGPGGSSGDSGASGGSYRVTDQTGRTITLKGKPHRIVSLTYGTDEMLADLVSPDRMAAYSRWAGDPEITFLKPEQLAAIGGHKAHGSAEEIVALQPDLVVASKATDPDLVRGLEAMGITVYVADSPRSFDGMCEKLLSLAKAVGEEPKAEAIVRSMRERLARLEKRLDRIPPDKRKTVVAFNFVGAFGRKGELFDDMLTHAHVINGAATLTPLGADGQITKEQVVRVDPDIFLLPTWNYNGQQDVKAYADSLLHDPAYRTVKAVRNRQLIFIPDKYRYVASHHVIDAIERIAADIYPEMYSKEDSAA